MNRSSYSNRTAGLMGKVALGLASMCLTTAAMGAGVNDVAGGPSTVSTPASARIAPAGTVVGSAVSLVPDGSNLYQNRGADTVRWYQMYVEPGKTYVVEAFDPYSDNIAGATDGMGIYDSDGTTTPPPETSVNCGNAARAPGLLNFADRCIIRTYVPDTIGTTLNKRVIYIKESLCCSSSYQIRARESTIYGRWTTNGYDFHVELQNTGADSMCVQVLLYPNAGFTYTGAGFTNVPLYATSMTVPAYGANKIIVPNGTTSGGTSHDLRGTLRLHDCGGGQLNTASLNVSTFAYNPVTDKFLYFFTSNSNNGTSGSF